MTETESKFWYVRWLDTYKYTTEALVNLMEQAFSWTIAEAKWVIVMDKNVWMEDDVATLGCYVWHAYIELDQPITIKEMCKRIYFYSNFEYDDIPYRSKKYGIIDIPETNTIRVLPDNTLPDCIKFNLMLNQPKASHLIDANSF